MEMEAGLTEKKDLKGNLIAHAHFPPVDQVGGAGSPA
jgi:hypothetical protein